MSKITRGVVPGVFVVLLTTIYCAPPTLAGLLAGNPNAYNDGNGPAAGAWTGSTPYVQGTLQGFVDWAVFGPGQFPYSNYTPTSGELTYAYQVFETGAAPLSTFTVALTDSADNIGAFNDLPGVAPSSSTLVANTSAAWQFPGVPQGSNTEGLAFSSIRVPQNLFGVVVDTGQSQFVIPLPSPSATSIPEPATAFGVAGLLAIAPLLRRRTIARS